MGRRLSVAIVALLLVVGGGPPAVAAETVPVPTATAALGDSITRAFHSNCGLLQDCPANSWSTGSAVDSHVQRLEALSGTAIRGDNLAVTGAVAADMPGQAGRIASDVGYVTMLIGANDACTDTVGEMTAVSAFRQSIATALDTVHTRSPEASVHVVSIPDLHQLWDVGRTSGSARFFWGLYGICQSMLADPGSTQPADVQRRATVRQRVVDYNTVLVEECGAYAGTCHDDGGAVFGYPFELGQLSTIDYFHPNVAGQEVLAQVTWDAGYDWDPGEPPTNTAPVADAGTDQVVTADESGGATVALDGSGSSDADGDPLSWTWAWTSGTADGVTPNVVLPTGTTTVTLTVDDGNGGSASDDVTVVVDPYVAPPQEVVLHVGDLDGSTVTARRNRWDATVEATVHDGDDTPVAGVHVDGTWGGGANGNGTCVTGASGTCSVTITGLKRNRDTATFTVTALSSGDAAFDGAANHDPDGDSNGSTITLTRP